MELLNYIPESTPLLLLIALMFGACIGSFLNVVVHRLPIMMYKEWEAQCSELQNDPLLEQLPAEPISLSSPRSSCPSCNQPIHPLHNIPIISYILLRAKCRSCGASISPRYIIVEAACGLLCAFVVFQYGVSADTLFILLFSFLLMPLIFIDLQHKLLPDNITFLLLWAGVIYAITGHGIDLRSSTIGIMAGYLSLWIVYVLFKVFTGKEGMGHGDFKLLAAIGAWVGWQQLLPVILIASISGTLSVVIVMLLNGGKSIGAIPFGPFLAIGGWITLLWGEQIIRLYFATM